jgi:hypothetical protein
MNKAVITLVILVLILSGTFTFIYFKYQKPINEPEISTLSISAEFEGKKITTGFKLNGEFFTTSNLGHIQIEVPKGYLISLEHINLDGQEFYKQKETINITRDIQRYDFILKEMKNLSITKQSGNPIVLNVSSKDYQDLHFCLKWSLAYIFVRSNFTEISKPSEFEKWDRCYKTDVSLENSNLIIPISFQELSPPRDSDYINISLFNPSLIDKYKNERIK